MKALAKAAACVSLLLVAGCEVAPTRIDGQPVQFKSARTPYAAAICIARNARERAGGSLQAEERTVGTASWEIVVRSGASLLATVEVHDDGVGSAVIVRMTDAAPRDRAGFARRLAEGC